MKKAVSFILCLILIFGLVAIGGKGFSLIPDSFNIKALADSETATNYKVGDVVEFGSYPQRKVTSDSLIASLNSQGGSWISYDYYSGTGSGHSDGQMKASDYMKYKDVTLYGNRYRGVKFTTYRPVWTHDVSSVSTVTTLTSQDENGYSINNVYWFKYEPLKWRVLDPKKGLILCENIIDSQPFSNYAIKSDGESYNESGKFCSDWESSSLRKWLNESFYTTAFSSEEKKQINSATLKNECYDSLIGKGGYSKYDSADTTDNVFLLSYNEANNTAFGFLSNESRCAKGTEYAKCQGLQVYESTECSYWRLRSPGSATCYACYVEDNGSTSGGHSFCYCGVSDTDDGIRPSICLKVVSQVQAGTETPYEGYKFYRDTYSFSNFDSTECSDPKCKFEEGHCFGMAVTSSAYYLGILSKGANQDMPLYDFPLNKATASVIHYYQGLQNPYENKATVAGRSYWLSHRKNSDISKDWNETIKYLKENNKNFKGDLVLDICYGPKMTHSVNFINYECVDGQDRIYIYDSTDPSSRLYIYKGADSKIYQYTNNIVAPKNDHFLSVVSLGLVDVNKYFKYANESEVKLETRYVIFALADTIKVENVQAYPINQGSDYRGLVAFLIPDNLSSVKIKPLVDNAEFVYMDETYPFDKIDDDTYAVFTLSTSVETNNATFKIENAPSPKQTIRMVSFNGTKNINYKEKVKIYASATGLPKDYKLVIAEGTTPLAEIAGNPNDTVYLEWTSENLTKDTTYNVTIINQNRQLLLNKNGELIQNTIDIKVNNSFFARLIAFFKQFFVGFATIDVKH